MTLHLIKTNCNTSLVSIIDTLTKILEDIPEDSRENATFWYETSPYYSDEGITLSVTYYEDGTEE